MKPDWDKLGGKFADSEVVVIADVDCTDKKGESLCGKSAAGLHCSSRRAHARFSESRACQRSFVISHPQPALPGRPPSPVQRQGEIRYGTGPKIRLWMQNIQFVFLFPGAGGGRVGYRFFEVQCCREEKSGRYGVKGYPTIKYKLADDKFAETHYNLAVQQRIEHQFK